MFALFSNLSAQIAEIKKLDRASGLVSNKLSDFHQCIVRDGLGYIWIVGEVGLSRYDGYDFRNYAKISKSSFDIPNHHLNCIITDENDNLWIGTHYDGVLFFDRKKETFINLDELIADSTAYLAQVVGLAIHKSKLIVATFLNGVYAFDLATGTSEKLQFRQQFQFLGIDTTSHGELLFTTFHGVVIKAKDNSEEFYENIDGRSAYIMDIEEIDDDKFLVEYWFPHDTYMIDRTRESYTKVAHDKSAHVSEIFRKDENSLWRFYDQQTIEVLNNDGEAIGTVSTKEFGGGDLELKGIKEDISGNLIYNTISNGAGKIVLETPIFSYLPDNKYIAAKQIQDKVYFYSRSEIYNATEDKVLSFYPNDIYVHDFQIDSQGTMFMSHMNLRNNIMDTTFMMVYDSKGKRIDKHQARLQEYIEVFNDGRVITESNDWPLYIDDDLGYTSIAEIYEEVTGKDFLDYNARFFKQTSNGDVWITTYSSGTVRLYNDFSEYETIEIDPSETGLLNHEGIYYAYENDKEQVFFATERNINVYDMRTGTFSYLNLEEEYVDNIVGIGQSETGDMFFLTESFIYSIDTTGHQLKIRLPEKYRPMDLDQGWKSKDLVIKDNYLFYSGIKGLVQVSLRELSAQRIPQTPIFTDFYINRKKIFPNDDTEILDSSILYQHDIGVSFKDRNIGFQFVSIDGQSIDVEYHFKLHGFDREWTTTTTDRTVHYTNVDPGKYKFEVKVRSGSGTWSSESVVCEIQVKRPWYSTIWAYLLYFVAVFSLLYAIYRNRILQLTRYQNLRTKISSDLHDDVGTLLSSVAMQSEVLGINAPENKVAQFEKLSRLSREAMGRMRDTVWAIDSRKDDLDSLVDRMQDYLTDMSDNARLKVDFQHSVSNLKSKIPPDLRQNVYLVFKEAVNNAYKYSKGNELVVKLFHSSSGLELIIRDNGQVDSTKVRTSGTGMSNIKMRADRIGGKLEISTEEGFSIRLAVE